MTNEEFEKLLSYKHIKNKNNMNDIESTFSSIGEVDISCFHQDSQMKFENCNFLTQEEPEDFKEEIILNTTTFIDYFKQNNFADLFQKAVFTLQTEKNREEVLAPFFKLVTETSLKRIFKANRMLDFLNELEIFLNNNLFNEHEKKSFINDQANLCLLYSLNARKFDLATNISKYRKNKFLTDFNDYITRKIGSDEYDILDHLFELSDSITMNNSQILRVLFNGGCRDFNKIKYFIEKYNFDINGLGNIPGGANKYTFAHAVVEKDGTKANIFFEEFVKNFNNKIDFDIQAIESSKNRRFNFLDVLINSKLETPMKLYRLTKIMQYCSLSEKHIANIVQYLIDENNNIILNYYDNEVYDALFAHEKFNSSLYDREAFLNKLLKMDFTGGFYQARKASNFTVNPTSIILDKFLQNAKPAIPMEQHPLITWIMHQNEHYSRDTLKSLMIFYKDEIKGFDFKGIKINPVLAKGLEEYGMNIPAKKRLFSFLNKKKIIEHKVDNTTSIVNVNNEKDEVTKIVFNNTLFEQIKDNDVKRYVDSILLNAEQFNMLLNGHQDFDSEHYINNLLPKFLNKTIENYLHFAILEEENAKANVMIQLKLISKKTFEILNQGLEQEKSKIIFKDAVHTKVIEKY